MVASVVRCDQMCKWMKYSTTELQWVSLVTRRRNYEWDSVVLRWKWDWQLACHVSTDHNYLPICTAFIWCCCWSVRNWDSTVGKHEWGTLLLWCEEATEILANIWAASGELGPTVLWTAWISMVLLNPHLSLTVLKRIFAPFLNT